MNDFWCLKRLNVSGNYHFDIFEANITREQYFQDAIDLLKGYEPAVKNLGNPIKHNKKTFDEKDAFNQITNTNVKVRFLDIITSFCYLDSYFLT